MADHRFALHMFIYVMYVHALLWAFALAWYSDNPANRVAAVALAAVLTRKICRFTERIKSGE